MKLAWTSVFTGWKHTLYLVFVLLEIFATCVPAKAKKRKSVVPTNSPMTATMCPRAPGGKRCKVLLNGPAAELAQSLRTLGISVFILRKGREIGRDEEF